MALITIRDVSIGFRGPDLLDEVNCQIESGQRIGLLGRNGAGKTTLMKMLSGQLTPDHGEIIVAPHTKISLLQQDVPQDIEDTAAEVVMTGTVDSNMDEWQAEQATERILSRMFLDPHVRFNTLSSGMKRRVLLAKSLVQEPDVLLLDEPTNHLDVDAIEWLENFLGSWRSTFLFVTHDRMFLRKLSTRILEIDRGQIFDWSCDYDTFLNRKEQAIAAQEKQDALFDKRLAEEERWIRQGIKARRTRNEGRVRALKKMREEHADRRSKVGTVNLRISEEQRSGNLVTVAKDVSFAYDERPILENFSTMIMRGDKVGVIGPNGAGKTTLLRILLGQLEPQSGSVRTGTNLQIAYFDQLREQLNEDETVQHNVSDGYDQIKIGGRSQHVIGYLQNFLFPPERARTPVRFLSGGERNRVLLAKLFAKPANTIVLDEPTNDLDTETLELLEEKLVEYAGTVIVVSHDRAFLNNVVTSTLVYEGTTFKEYAGGYDDWVRQRTTAPATTKLKAGKAKKPKESPAAESNDSKRKLSYKEKRELESLPGQIEQMEAQVAEFHERMGQPEFYQKPGDEIANVQAELKAIQDQLATAYSRWEELE